MTSYFGVKDLKFRRALNDAFRNREVKTIYFIDILGAHAWANPIFNSYLYEQIPIYFRRNYTHIWNLTVQNELLKKKIEERLAKYVDVDDVMPDYNSGGPMDLHIVRVLSWSDDDMRKPTTQNLIAFHRAFNIPLFFLPPQALYILVRNNRVEFHLAVDNNGNTIENGCWVYDHNRRKREPYDRKLHAYLPNPYEIIKGILEHPDCEFAIEKRRSLCQRYRGGRKILVINSPTKDEGGFRGSPTSLLYAIGPLIEEIKDKKINIVGFSHLNIFDPVRFSNDLETKLKNKLKQIKPEIVAISTTSDAFHIAGYMANIVKNFNPNTVVILGGPHCDELDLLGEDEVNQNNNPFNCSESFDFVISGDGEYMLPALVHLIIDSMSDDAPNINDIKTHVMRNAEDFNEIEGAAYLYFKLNGEIKKIQSSMKQIDLNKLPPLRYEYLDKSHLEDFDIFRNESGQIKKCVQVMTHRGCSGLCNFCSEKTQLNTSKTADTVIKEIWHYIEKLGVEAIFFDDSTFIENPTFVDELCDKMIRSGLSRRVKWGCLNRFDRVKDEMLIEKMVEAGLDYMYLGLELYDDRLLGDMNKDTRRSMNRKKSMTDIINDALEILKRNNIRVGVSILFGYPGSNERIEIDTIKFVGEMVKNEKIHLVSLSLFNYHPLSHLTNLRRTQLRINYFKDEDKIKRQNTAPWCCFEEGGWFHDTERQIDEDYLARLLWEVEKFIPKDVLVRKKEVEEFIKSEWGKKLLTEPACFELINNALGSQINLSEYKVGDLEDYVRYDTEIRQEMNSIYQRILDNLERRTREFMLIWGPPGSGKTSFIKQIGENVKKRGMIFRYFKLDDLDFNIDSFRSELCNLEEKINSPILCFIDEIQVRPNETYDIIKSFLDRINDSQLPIVVVLAGSKGKDIKEMQHYMKQQNQGPDILSRIPPSNKRSIPPMKFSDRIIIAVSAIRKACEKLKKNITAIEKLALHWIALSPMLSDAREIIEFIEDAVERASQEKDKLRYSDLFDPDESKNMELFKEKIPREHLSTLQDSFLKISC